MAQLRPQLGYCNIHTPNVQLLKLDMYVSGGTEVAWLRCHRHRREAGTRSRVNPLRAEPDVSPLMGERKHLRLGTVHEDQWRVRVSSRRPLRSRIGPYAAAATRPGWRRLRRWQRSSRIGPYAAATPCLLGACNVARIRPPPGSGQLEDVSTLRLSCGPCCWASTAVLSRCFASASPARRDG